MTNCTICSRLTAWATAFRTRGSLNTSFSTLKPMWLEDRRGMDVTFTPRPSSRGMCWGATSMSRSMPPVSSSAAREASSGSVRKMIRSTQGAAVLS